MKRLSLGGNKMRLALFLFFSGILIIFYSWEKEEVVGIDPEIVTGRWESHSSYNSNNNLPLNIGEKYTIDLSKDNTFNLAGRKGLWKIQGSELLLQTTDGYALSPNKFRIKNFSEKTISLEMDIKSDGFSELQPVTLVFNRMNNQSEKSSELARLFNFK